MNLNQIIIPSIDLTKSIAFYQLMGLHLIVESLPHYARFECIEGHSTFSIHFAEELPRGNGVWVYFECENLDKFVDELIGKGIVFDEMPNDKNYASSGLLPLPTSPKLSAAAVSPTCCPRTARSQVHHFSPYHTKSVAEKASAGLHEYTKKLTNIRTLLLWLPTAIFPALGSDGCIPFSATPLFRRIM